MQGKRHHQLPGPKGAGRAAVQRRLRGSEPAAALVLQRRLVGIERHLLDAHLARPPTHGVALLVGRGERALRAHELPRPGVTGDAPRFRRGASRAAGARRLPHDHQLQRLPLLLLRPGGDLLGARGERHLIDVFHIE